MAAAGLTLAYISPAERDGSLSLLVIGFQRWTNDSLAAFALAAYAAALLYAAAPSPEQPGASRCCAHSTKYKSAQAELANALIKSFFKAAPFGSCPVFRLDAR